ncbi:MULTISPECIES: NUDIX hydrolase [Vibrio]|uniref:GDP-mannose pyrophosphatase n=1 Tax=Vibrio casei TaxID=673372 RepID=A0A368LH95_9VIBR|nr:MULTISPECIES: NUDIX hydrolase [Vibrio]RCS70114.1 NUDIX hydrolase [Vibrio casei]SJN24080.1 ADP-ribose pyrophosphatase [Vibrio casei]HBV77434.1 NUDIX hydrolase [Vibrio sp.]
MNQQTIHRWKNIELIEEDSHLPNGRIVRHTTIVHPGAAVILPITLNNQVILLRQFRPSLNKWILELPAGTIENDEAPIECARRELTEETGYQANTFHPLGQCTPLAGFCDEIQHLFVATDLNQTASLSLDEDEVIEVIKADLNTIEHWIRHDKITDAKTITCISKAKLCGYFD